MRGGPRVPVCFSRPLREGGLGGQGCLRGTHVGPPSGGKQDEGLRGGAAEPFQTPSSSVLEVHRRAGRSLGRSSSPSCAWGLRLLHDGSQVLGLPGARGLRLSHPGIQAICRMDGAATVGRLWGRSCPSAQTGPQRREAWAGSLLHANGNHWCGQWSSSHCAGHLGTRASAPGGGHQGHTRPSSRARLGGTLEMRVPPGAWVQAPFSQKPGPHQGGGLGARLVTGLREGRPAQKPPQPPQDGTPREGGQRHQLRRVRAAGAGSLAPGVGPRKRESGRQRETQNTST